MLRHMTRDTIWKGEPCPNSGCPRPGAFRSLLYRRKPWICPICCYGWICQDTPHISGATLYRWIRTDWPVPFYRPGKRRAKTFKPFL